MEHLLAERVKDIMEELEYSPSSFADTIDVPRPIMSHILSGRNKPSLDVIQKILMRFPELNPWWLLTGKGTMKQLNLFEEEENLAPIRQSSQNYAASSPVAATTKQKEVESVPVPPVVPEPTFTTSAPVSEQAPPTPKQEQIPDSIKNAAAPESIPSPELLAQVRTDKKIEKMIVFYSDKTFSIYHPE